MTDCPSSDSHADDQFRKFMQNFDANQFAAVVNEHLSLFDRAPKHSCAEHVVLHALSLDLQSYNARADRADIDEAMKRQDVVHAYNFRKATLVEDQIIFDDYISKAP